MPEPGQSPPVDGALQPGIQLGHYRILKVLGRGGFGITYQAHDSQLNRTVAIKEYFANRQMTRAPDGLTVVGPTDDPTYRQRLDGFLDEARTLAQFRDPRIVHVHGFHEANNTAYLVMDFIEGQSLRDHVINHGLITLRDAVGILRDILLGLRAIHARNYLHRDIKPANLLRRSDGSILLLDFGSARQSVADQDQDFTVFVSPGYAPMEQYSRNEAQGPATDLYAAAACVLYCLTGSSPPEAIQRTVAEQMNASDGIDPLLRQVAGRSQTGAALAEILHWMLQPQSANRPQSAEAVLHRLDAIPLSGPITDEVPTIPSAVGLSQLRSIPARVINEIRQQLFQAVGDRAAGLMTEAIKGARNAQQLIDQIASRLGDDPRSRTVIDQVTALLVQTARTATASGVVKAINASGAGAASAPAAPAREPDKSATGSITNSETTQHITRELAKHIGPIAHMLVKKQLAKSSSLRELLDRLEAEIPSEPDRRAFRAEMRKLAS